MITASILLNRASDTERESWAPITAPTSAGADRKRLSLKSETPFLRKPAPANMLWTVIAKRFVPFATVAGRPVKISIGRVRSEPPPARVLINPAITPTAKIIKNCHIPIDVSTVLRAA
jgi:hypothetical protein